MSDNSASRERKAPPARSEDGPPRTRGNLGAPQIWHPNPAGSPCVCDLFPWLSPPEEGRDPACETLGMERPRERMWPVDREVSLRGEGGGEVRGHTYCSWGSARMASGPATPCPGFGHGGAPAPVPGLAPVLAPSPGPSPGLGPGHLRTQTCGADCVLCTPLHTRTLRLLSPGSWVPIKGQMPRTPGPGTASGAWAHFCGLAQAGLALVGPPPSRGPFPLHALPVSRILRSPP